MKRLIEKDKCEGIYDILVFPTDDLFYGKLQKDFDFIDNNDVLDDHPYWKEEIYSSTLKLLSQEIIALDSYDSYMLINFKLYDIIEIRKEKLIAKRNKLGKEIILEYNHNENIKSNSIITRMLLINIGY